MIKVSAPVRQTIRAIIGPFAWIALFSFAINLIYLASPLYMMQVYDRVMHSQSIPTLLYLSLAITVCYVAYAVLDGVRGRLLAEVGVTVEEQLGYTLMAHVTKPKSQSRSRPVAVHIARDLDTVRQFTASATALAFLDAPWAPIFLVAITLIHPILGMFALGAAIMLFGLTIIGERLARRPMAYAGQVAARAYQFSDAVSRYADCARTMGLGAALGARWSLLRRDMLGAQIQASHRAIALGSVTKFARMFFQSGILGLGAWLAVKHQVSGGAIFAGSLLLGRTLAPVEAIIGAWRPALAAKDALSRIDALVAIDRVEPIPVILPAPKGDLILEAVSWNVPGSDRPVVRGIAARIKAGTVLVIVGPSAAGKSTVARLITGSIRPITGIIRLDGGDLATWNSDQLGRAIGYLPQDVALFPGTIRDNIARFSDASDEEVIAAAKAAHAHDLIVRLPLGYRTMVEDGGAELSGGQKQRIALARALFGEPPLIVLDEPNANLDSDGEAALNACVRALKQQGRTVVMITHRMGLVRISDYVATMVEGQIVSLQRQDEFMAQQGPRALVAGGR
jgi:ATP-binding cassette subfamily C protein